MIRVFNAPTLGALFFWSFFVSHTVGQGSSTTPERALLSPKLAAAAQSAVQGVMDEVVKGNLKPTLERMHPLWKKKAAKRMGGMDRLEVQMDQALTEMRAKGITILSSRASAPTSGFEVWEEAEKKVVNGREVDTGRMKFRDWLVFVPTTTRYRMINPQTKKAMVIERTSFLLAIMTKGKPDWTFIDGATITPKEMRNLFPNLPAQEAELRLPKKGGRVVQ